MLKFTASGNGRTLIGLGLEAGNIRKLQEGKPIRVQLSDLGFTGAMGTVDIMIFYGEDAETMKTAMQPFMSSETVIKDERGTHRQD